LRESLFNILIHAYDDPIADARVLDLFAGTGALGIEAIVARREVCAVCRQRRRSPRIVTQQCRSARAWRRHKSVSPRCRQSRPAHPVEPFSLVFLDPPYRMNLAGRRWRRCVMALLTSGALLVVEEAKAARCGS